MLAFGPPAKPPGPAAPRPLPALTLDHYAQLSAEVVIEQDPARRAAVLARWGVDDADALTAAWRARLAADPVLAGRWSAAYAEHDARLRRERTGQR